MRKENKKSRIKEGFKKIKLIFGITLLVSAILTYAMLVYAYLHYTEKNFRIENVTVKGCRILNPKTIEKLIYQKTKNNVDVKAIHSLLMLNPWIKSAHVSFFPPDTVYVKIEEKQPAALIEYGNEPPYIIDSNEEIIVRYKKGLNINPKSLPHLIIKDKKLIKNKALLASILSAYQKLNEFGKIDSVDVVSECYQLVHFRVGLNIAIDSLHCPEIAYFHLRQAWARLLKKKNKLAWVSICFKNKFVLKWKKEKESGGDGK